MGKGGYDRWGSRNYVYGLVSHAWGLVNNDVVNSWRVVDRLRECHLVELSCLTLLCFSLIVYLILMVATYFNNAE